MTSLTAAVYTGEPQQVQGCKGCGSSPRTSRTATTTADIPSTAGRKSPPRAESNGAGRSGGPARTAGRPDGDDRKGP